MASPPGLSLDEELEDVPSSPGSSHPSSPSPVRSPKKKNSVAEGDHSEPTVADMQRAQLSAVQGRSTSFRGFSEDELDALFPLLTVVEVRNASARGAAATASPHSFRACMPGHRGTATRCFFRGRPSMHWPDSRAAALGALFFL